MLNKKFYRLAFEYHQRWAPYPKSGDEWELAALEGARICTENGNDPFLRDLMAAAYHDMDRMNREKDQSAALEETA